MDTPIRFNTGFTEVAGSLYFVAQAGNISELWKTDGTQAGTLRLDAGDLTSIANLTDVNGELYFLGSDSTAGGELWKTDGTQAGTQRITDIRVGPSSSGPREIVELNGIAYFFADDGVHGLELWKSDGTAAGTTLVIDLSPPNVSYTVGLTVLNDALYISKNGSFNSGLWKSDGTAEGTTLLGENATMLIEVGGTIYFRGSDDIAGEELWKTDGTLEGTVRVSDIRPGIGGTQINHLTDHDGVLYFTANDQVHGRELWTSDGTEAGTVLVADLRPGKADGVSTIGISASGKLFFTGNNGYTGFEPWFLSDVVNTSPSVSVPVVVSASEDDSPLSVDLLAGAVDADPGDTLSVSELSLVSGNALGLTVTGSTIEVLPDAYNFLSAGQTATVEYSYLIRDSAGGTVMQTATITINGADDAPIVATDQALLAQGSSANVLDVLANDHDPDLGPLLIQSVSATARNATVVISPDQKTILYTPRTPSSTGTDSFTYTVVDEFGSTSTATASVTILANTVVVDAATLGSEVAAQQTAPDEPLDVVVNLNPSNYSNLIDTINALPPVGDGGQTVFVTLAISDGVYPGAVVSPPPGVVIILNGFNGGITLVGASPALTVSSGEVVIENGVVLTNSTDAPTILVTGGHLQVRNSTIEESTGFARAAIEITGGTVDLGTSSSPGGNTFIVRGEGVFLQNLSGNTVENYGNTFVSDSGSSEIAITGAPLNAAEGAVITLGSTVSGVAAASGYVWSLTKDGMPYPLPADTVATAPTFSFVPSDNGQYVVYFTVTDEDGSEFTAERVILVRNVAPSAFIVGAPAVSEEGSLIELQAVVADPGAVDTHAYSWSVTKDGATYGLPEGTTTETTFGFMPGDDGEYAINLTVTDDDGAKFTVSHILSVSNVAPVAMNDVAAVTEDGTVVGNVLANDTDAGVGDRAALTVSMLTGPAHGVLQLRDDGTFTYTPGVSRDDLTSDSFTYLVTDPNGSSSVASVSIAIQPAVMPGKVTLDSAGVLRVGGTAGTDLMVFTSFGGLVLNNGS